MARKWIWAGGAALTIGLTFAAGVQASDTVKKVEAYVRGDYTVKVNGEAATLKHPPLLYDDALYLSLSDIGKAMQANVAWDGKTKTAFLNPRIYAEQPVVDDASPYTTLNLGSMYGYQADYLGQTYQVLITQDAKGVRYYRQRDLQMMGIDTNGLQKARQQITGDLYVSETEAKKAWKEKPTLAYLPTRTVVTGESDPDKLALLSSFKPASLWVQGDTADSNQIYYQNQLQYGIVYAVDAVPGQPNHYTALFYFNNAFYRYYLTLAPTDPVTQLTSNSSAKWVIQESHSELLGKLKSAVPSPYYVP